MAGDKGGKKGIDLTNPYGLATPPASRPGPPRQPTTTTGPVYQSLAPRAAFAQVIIGGFRFAGIEQFTEYLDTLHTDEQLKVIREIQAQVRTGVEIFQDIADQVWQLMLSRVNIIEHRARNTVAFDHEFHDLREHAREGQNRRERATERRRAITVHSDWMTNNFFTLVVQEQTNSSTAVLDALDAARKTGIAPLLLFQRASALRIQRIAGVGPYGRRAANTQITPEDIRFASELNQNNTFRHPASVNTARETDAALQNLLQADTQGIYWTRGVAPNHIDRAYSNSGRGTATRQPSWTDISKTGTSTQEQTNSVSDSFPPTNGQQGGLQGTQASNPLAGPATRSQTGTGAPPVGYDALHQGRTKGPSSRKSPVKPSTRAELPTRGVQAGPNPTDLAEQLEGLRVATFSPPGSPTSTLNVPGIAIPIDHPTALDQAIWDLARRQTQAIVQGTGPPSFSNQDKAAFAASVTDITAGYNSISRLSAGIRERFGQDHDSFRCYMEGLYRGAQITQASGDWHRYTVTGIEELISNLDQAFLGRTVRIGTGTMQDQDNQGIAISPTLDFATLGRGGGRSGWLNQYVIMAALLGLAREAGQETSTFIVDVDELGFYLNGQANVGSVTLPRGQTNIVIPFHWGNHWTVGLVNFENRTIQHLDSFGSTHNVRAIQTIRNLLGAHTDRFGGQAWTVSTTRSGQQANSDDCGLWVIENARALINGNSTLEPATVDRATRRWVADELYGHLMADTPPLTAAERAVQVAERAGLQIRVPRDQQGPGHSATSPWEIDDSSNPFNARTPTPSTPRATNSRGRGSSIPVRQGLRGAHRNGSTPTTGTADSNRSSSRGGNRGRRGR